ncbi:hypothetical protein PanWU01x14_280720, partial [Parasponia andersonii]
MEGAYWDVCTHPSIVKEGLSLLINAIPSLTDTLTTLPNHLALPLTFLSEAVNEETWSITDSMDGFKRMRSALEMTLQ